MTTLRPDPGKVWVTPVATIDCPRCGKNVILLGQDRCQACNDRIYEVQLHAAHKVLMDMQTDLDKLKASFDAERADAEAKYKELEKRFLNYVAEHEESRRQIAELHRALAEQLTARAVALSGLQARVASYEKLIAALEPTQQGVS